MHEPRDDHAVEPTSAEAKPEPRATLANYLAENHTDCPKCGYDLYGHGDNRCPECGERLVLGVGLPVPALAGFATCIIMLTLTTPWALLFLMFGLGDGLGEMWNEVPLFFLGGVLSVVAAAGLILLLFKAKYFVAMSPDTRGGLTMGAVVFSIIIHALVLVAIFP